MSFYLRGPSGNPFRLVGGGYVKYAPFIPTPPPIPEPGDEPADNWEQELEWNHIHVSDTGNVTTNGSNLQTQITNAPNYTVLLLDPGVVYRGIFAAVGKIGITLAMDGYDNSNGDAPPIESGIHDGTSVRLTPTLAANFPILECNYGNNGSIFQATTGTKISLRCIKLRPISGGTTPNNWITIGSNDQNREDVPQDCHLDRVICYMPEPNPVAVFGIQQFISFSAAESTIHNCYLDGALPDNISLVESHCIYIDRTTGRVGIYDNFIGTSSINILVGGGGPLTGWPGHADFTTSDDEAPKDFFVRRNHFCRDWKYNRHHPSWNGFGVGFGWRFKGACEWKQGKQITIEGNVFDGIWWDGGDTNYASIQMSPRNNEHYSGSRYSSCDDNFIKYNFFVNCTAGVELAAGGGDASGGAGPEDDSDPSWLRGGINGDLSHNVLYNISRTQPIGADDGMNGGNGLSVACIKNVKMNHNTVHFYGHTGRVMGFSNSSSPPGHNQFDMDGLEIKFNRIGPCQVNTYSWASDSNVSEGLGLMVGVGLSSLLKNYMGNQAYSHETFPLNAKIDDNNDFSVEFEELPTIDANYRLVSPGNFNPKPTAPFYNQATGSDYLHCCADWNTIVAKMGTSLFAEIGGS